MKKEGLYTLLGTLSTFPPYPLFLPTINRLNPLFHNHYINPNGAHRDHFRIKNYN